jgi:hypothetical protein
MPFNVELGPRVLAEPPSERALRLTWRAWRGALAKMLCVMIVGQLSDPLEGHAI